jgi:hypothetical protein
VETTAVPVDEPARRIGDKLAERRDPIAKRHAASVPRGATTDVVASPRELIGSGAAAADELGGLRLRLVSGLPHDRRHFRV